MTGFADMDAPDHDSAYDVPRRAVGRVGFRYIEGSPRIQEHMGRYAHPAGIPPQFVEMYAKNAAYAQHHAASLG